MILASYYNVQIASFASWDIQDSDVQEDNFSSWNKQVSSLCYLR